MAAMKKREDMNKWLDEWVYGCSSRQAYLDHYAKVFHISRLNALKAKPLPSAPASYGAAFHSAWDENGRDRYMGKTPEELELLLEQREKLYG